MLKINKIKGRKYFLLSALFLCASALGIFIGSKAIIAQIQNIYGERLDQISGLNALMSAAAANDVSGVRFFSKGGKSLIDQKNIGGATALHIASREKNFEIVAILLENNAEVNVSDNEGWTPLMRASLAGSAEIVDLLLSKGADASPLNSVGESAIIHASSADCDGCLNSMFTKFNFIKLMDEQLLKSQINDAFVIARNHDFAANQKLLENYLDQTIKMSALANGSIASDGISIVEDNKLNLISQGNSRNKLVEKNLPLNEGNLRSKQIGAIKKKFKLVSSDPIYSDESPQMLKGKKTANSKSPDSYVAPTQIFNDKRNKFTLISSDQKSEAKKEKEESKISKKEFKPNDSNAVFLMNSKIDNQPIEKILKSKKFKFSQGPKSDVASEVKNLETAIKPSSQAKESQPSFAAEPKALLKASTEMFKLSKGAIGKVVDKKIDSEPSKSSAIKTNESEDSSIPEMLPINSKKSFKFSQGPSSQETKK